MAKDLNYKASDEESSEAKPKNFEDILDQVGGFGRFQAMILLFVLFYEIPSGFLAFVPVFVGGNPPEWKCETEDEIVEMNSKDICQCTNGTRSAPPYTIVSEWDLICEKSWVVPSITSIQMFGMFFGNTIPPQISDWYGRKVTFLILMVLMAVGESVSALATNPYIFAVARFICGIGLAGYFSLNGIYTMEFLTPKWRQLGGCLGPLGEGLMILGILAYFIKPWRLLLWATTFPFITVIFVFPFLPESPRWLLRQKRIKEAEGVLRYIARVNGVKPKGLGLLKSIAEQEGDSSDTRYSYLDLFRLKEVRVKTLIFIGIWFCWAFTYFGLSYNIRNFGVDPYLMTVLMGAVDAVGFRAALLVNNRLGRRKALVVFTGISAIFFLPVALVHILVDLDVAKKYQSLMIICVLLGKMCVAGSRSAVRVLTVESYPVSIRTMGFGISRVSATLGGIAAPQIAYLGSKWPSVPLFAFGILGFLGSLLSLLLNETSGKPLQDEMKADQKGKIAPEDREIQSIESIDGKLASLDKRELAIPKYDKNKNKKKNKKRSKMNMDKVYGIDPNLDKDLLLIAVTALMQRSRSKSV